MKLGLRLQAVGAFGPLLICAFMAAGWLKAAMVVFVLSLMLFGAGMVLTTSQQTKETNTWFFMLCAGTSVCGRLLQISSSGRFSPQLRLGIRLMTFFVLGAALRYYIRSLQRVGADGKQLALALAFFVCGLILHVGSWQTLSWFAFWGGALVAALGYARYAQILITLASGDLLSSQERVEGWESE